MDMELSEARYQPSPRERDENHLSVYVGNLPYQITEDELKSIVSEFKNTEFIRLIRKESKTYCFLLCESEDDVIYLVRSLNKRNIMGRRVVARAHDQKLHEKCIEGERIERRNISPRSGEKDFFVKRDAHRDSCSSGVPDLIEKGNRYVDCIVPPGPPPLGLRNFKEGPPPLRLASHSVASSGNDCNPRTTNACKINQDCTCSKELDGSLTKKMYHYGSDHQKLPHRKPFLGHKPHRQQNPIFTDGVSPDLKGEPKGLSTYRGHMQDCKSAENSAKIEPLQAPCCSSASGARWQNSQRVSCNSEGSNKHVFSECQINEPRSFVGAESQVRYSYARRDMPFCPINSCRIPNRYEHYESNRHLPPSHSLHHASCETSNKELLHEERISCSTGRELRDVNPEEFTSETEEEDEALKLVEVISVSNFPFYTTEEEIYALFEDFEALDVYMVNNVPQRDQCTEAYVFFPNEELALDAILHFDNTVFKRRTLLVTDVKDSGILGELLTLYEVKDG